MHTAIVIVFWTIFVLANLQRNRASTLTTEASPCVGCGKPENAINAKFRRQKLAVELEKILRKLGLKKRPNISLGNDEVPTVLLAPSAKPRSHRDLETIDEPKEFFVIGNHVENGRNQSNRKTGKCFLRVLGPGVCGSAAAPCFSFQFASNPLVNSANLLFMMQNSSSSSQQIEIVSFKKVEPENSKTDHVTAGPSTADPNWLAINILPIVRHWTAPSRANTNVTVAFKLSCKSCEPDQVFGLRGQERPIVHIRTQIPTNRRRRGTDFCAPHNNFCCKRPFYVNFTEIGWNDWILQPDGYYANYCSGNCVHASIGTYNSLARQVARTKDEKGENYDRELIPCCSPSRMNPISLLYVVANGEVRKRILHNMVVESCGC